MSRALALLCLITACTSRGDGAADSGADEDGGAATDGGGETDGGGDGGTTDGGADGGGDGGADTLLDPAELPDWTDITVETRDGVTLTADWYPAAADSHDAVILLHMNPVYFDRGDWPAPFIENLRIRGWAVIVPDRRGAGDSEGDPEAATTGEGGRYDVEACVLQLLDHGAQDIAIIGASNGTTSMIDYALWAPGEGLPGPVSLGFMTGGTYTETQHRMEDVAALGTPAFFTYSSEEAQWSEAQRSLDPGTWGFYEYPTGDHGTRMFAAAPEVGPDILAALETHLP